MLYVQRNIINIGLFVLAFYNKLIANQLKHNTTSDKTFCFTNMHGLNEWIFAPSYFYAEEVLMIVLC